MNVVKCDQCKTAEALITHEGQLPFGWTNCYQHLCPTCSGSLASKISLLTDDLHRMTQERDLHIRASNEAQATIRKYNTEVGRLENSLKNVLRESQVQLAQKSDVINANTETIKAYAKSVKELTDERTEILARMQSMAKTQVSMENAITTYEAGIAQAWSLVGSSKGRSLPDAILDLKRRAEDVTTRMSATIDERNARISHLQNELCIKTGITTVEDEALTLWLTNLGDIFDQVRKRQWVNVLDRLHAAMKESLYRLNKELRR